MPMVEIWTKNREFSFRLRSVTASDRSYLNEDIEYA